MATVKPAKTSTRPGRPRAAVKKKANTAVAPKRTRRQTSRRTPWEHLGHPSSAVIVTGGASGIGRATALARAEAQVSTAITQVEALKAQYRSKQSEIQLAQSVLDYAARELGRQRPLAARTPSRPPRTDVW